MQITITINSKPGQLLAPEALEHNVGKTVNLRTHILSLFDIYPAAIAATVTAVNVMDAGHHAEITLEIQPPWPGNPACTCGYFNAAGDFVGSPDPLCPVHAA